MHALQPATYSASPISYRQRLIAAALAAFYIFALVLDRSAGVIFAVLVLSGLAVMARPASTSERSACGQMLKNYWPLHLAMAAPFIAVLCNQIASGHFAARSLDLPFRLALFGLVFWAIGLAPYKYLTRLHWAFFIGACCAAVKMYLLTDGGRQRYISDFIPMGIFAEMALLLGFFSLFSISWDAPGSKLKILLKVLAAFAGIYTAYLSASRGTWVTIPFFAMIAYLAAKDFNRKYKACIVVLCIAILGSVFCYGKIAEGRIAELDNDLQGYQQGTALDTALGTRFQLWKGALIVFKEHPVFGVGAENYRAAMQELSERKIITPAAATFAHSHNDVLFMMVKLGSFGLLAMLAVYFVPFFYFARELRHDDREVRFTAAMGLALCIGIAILGMTDVVFLWWEAFPFYAISIALFLTYIMKRKEYIALSNQ